MIPVLAHSLLNTVQHPVLHIRRNGHDHPKRRQNQDDGPPRFVQRSIRRLEELAPDDSRHIRAHDKEGHGDRPFAGCLSVEGQPGPVHGI